MPAYDPALRRRAKRGSQRQRGVWLHIAAEELQRAGVLPDEPAPWYRVWGSSRGGLFVRLYREV